MGVNIPDLLAGIRGEAIRGLELKTRIEGDGLELKTTELN